MTLLCVPGDLALSIDGPSKADITKQEKVKEATHVSYLPMSPGEYNINIKVKGKHIHGSPFSAKVSGKIPASRITRPNLEEKKQ